MKTKHTILLTTVCIFCALSFGHSCYAQTDKVLDSRPVWVSLGHRSFDSTYLDVIMVPGKFENLTSLEEEAQKIAIERRKGAMGSDGIRVRANRIGTPYYSEKEKAAYFLFQIGRKANGDSNKWEKIDIITSDSYPFNARVFVPGMAQIYKGNTGKGVAFIIGEALLIGGIATTEFMRRDYSIKINQTHNTKAREYYAHNANICSITRNACIGGAVALYVWNIIDGVVAKGRPTEHVSVDGKLLVFSPYISSDATGIAMNLKF